MNFQEFRIIYVYVQGNVFWDILVFESLQQIYVRIFKFQQKLFNEKRLFVLLVRSESYNVYLQSKEFYLFRFKIKGFDVVKLVDIFKVNIIQRLDGLRQNVGEKKMVGLYLIYVENRVMVRRNMGVGQNERQVRIDQIIRRIVEIVEEKYFRFYYSGGEVRVNDYFSVYFGVNVVI